MKDFRVKDTDWSVAFKGPGYSADAIVDRATGRYELTETRMGFFAVLNDLHKGRDPGIAWARAIDFSVVLMTLISLTGARRGGRRSNSKPLAFPWQKKSNSQG